MKIQSLIEREDGGADMVVTDITPYEVQLLMEKGFVALLEEYAKDLAEAKKVPTLLRKDIV